MSVTVMASVWKGSRSTGTARLVLLALADEASDEGEVTAYRRSLSHLSRKCACSTDSVRRAVANLVALGEVTVLKRGDGRSPTDYQINVGALASAVDEGGAGATPGVAPMPPQGSRPRVPRGSTAATPITPLFPVPPGGPPAGAADGDTGPEPPARYVARQVWEHKKPRPATKFVAVMKVAEALLEAGHQVDDVVAAMIAAPTITVAAVELQLSRRKPPAGGGRVDADRGGVSGLVDVL